MTETKRVAEYIANTASMLIPSLIQDDELPSINTKATAEAAIDAVVLQDPAMQSKRIWAMVFAVATAVLAVPEVQQYLGPWAPVLAAAISAALSGWSRASDPRPTR
jgi:hypothetical protein